jgi:hypothetical protein
VLLCLQLLGLSKAALLALLLLWLLLLLTAQWAPHPASQRQHALEGK